MGKQWTSGLFGIFDDVSVFMYGMFCTNYLYVDNYSRATGNSLLPGKKISDACQCIGCNDADGIKFANCVICQFVPCIVVLWRGAIREKYGIEGNLVGDALAHCCCGPLAVMQEAREIRLQQPSSIATMH